MNLAPLKSLCQIRHGGTPSKANSSYWNGGIPWVSPKDMKASILSDASDHISVEAVKDSATSIVPEKSILIVVRSGILAHSLPVAQVGKALAFNQDIKALTPDSTKVDPDYLFWFVRSQERRVLAQGVKKGATVHSVQSGFIENLQVPIFKHSEQLRTVDILARAEGIVQLRRDAERKCAELIPSLFLDMFGDPSMDSLDAPLVPLGSLLEAADYGSSAKASDQVIGLPMIRMGNVTYKGDLDLTDLKYVELDPHEAEKYRLAAGDLLFNRTNSKELVGKTGIWDGSREAIVASYFIRLRVKRTVLNPFFLWAFMNSAHMKRTLLRTARGAIGQSNINSKELRDFLVPLPALEKQNAFQARSVEIRDLAAQMATATEKAHAAFKAILGRTFSS